MRPRLGALSLLAFLVLDANAGAWREVTLVLSHALSADETAWLEVQVGAIERGEEIRIVTTSGRPLGVISPFGIRQGHQAGTYAVPLPTDAIEGGRVSLRLSLDEYGHAQRAPSVEEVESVRLKISRTTR
jgi:hypothetical protein